MAEKVKKTKKEDSVEENFVIEDAFERLEEIVAKLENPDTKLNEAMDLYKEGVVLSEKCRENLEGVETEIKILNTDNTK